MPETTRHDAWQAGDAYDLYMGRWSGKVAPRFLEWLDPASGLDWLEIGCGTGALSVDILRHAEPKSLTAVEPSEGFLAAARRAVDDPRATFLAGNALDLPVGDRSADAVVSGLVLNFVPDRERALAEMTRVARPGARVAFYVWDYPGRGMEMMGRFWDAAVALDPAAADLKEDQRFPFCTEEQLAALASRAGLGSVESTAIDVATVFADFDDYWRPFTLGAGPAPGYCADLTPEAREALRRRLEADLPRDADGHIPLKARAIAVKGTA